MLNEREIYSYEADMSPLATLAMERIQKVISEEEFEAFIKKMKNYTSPLFWR